jgi:uncharacterized protein YxjI
MLSISDEILNILDRYQIFYKKSNSKILINISKMLLFVKDRFFSNIRILFSKERK